MEEAEFKSPGKEFRGVPFWSWNDRLEDRELTRQIGEMDDKGWGGFFMHAREGLVTPYMTEEWMERVEACVEEAAHRGMGAWLYDEDRWPSGFAGGIVPAQRSEYRGKALLMRVSGRLDRVEDAIRVFKCDLREGEPENLAVVVEGERGERGKTYLYFNLFTSPIGQEWYGGYCYVDTLKPKAVDAFIESTYDPYYRRVGRWFGSTIPGIFTDEPNFAVPVPGVRGARLPTYALPWTEDLPERFRERKGYDIRDHLPSLFFNVGDYMRVRYDYWDTVTDLFLEAYTKRLFAWCERHGLRYTGHYLAEDTLVGQIRCAGAVMPHYEYMHVPGIDHLGRNVDHPLTVKQVSSVAEQLGKERVLSETYGGSGQSLTFEERKWIGDWEYVLGVNLLNHHLCLYTMRGLRKRDYPPNLFYQQPWWRYNRLMADYYARLSYALTRGRRVTDILVIHPIASAWAVYTPLKPRAAEQLNSSLEWLVKSLLELHRDYELGDERIIRGHGGVDGPAFVIGSSSYKAVILPPSVTLSRSTLDLLRRFVDNGGRLIALRPTPRLVEGGGSSDIGEVLGKALIVEDRDEEALLKALEAIPPRVEIRRMGGEPAREVWYHLRRDGDQRILFLANTSREEGFRAVVRIMGEGRVEEWNPLNGEVSPIPSRLEGGYTVIDLDFPPVGSHLIVLDGAKSPVSHRASGARKVGEVRLGALWRYRRLGLNGLTLDHCRVRLGNGRYGELLPVWKAHRAVLQSGIGTRFGVRYEFESGLEFKGGRRIYLVMESPEKYAIRVNGRAIRYRDVGYWTDTAFKKIDVGGLVRQGKNTVEIVGAVDFETEIESCYVVGDFGVESLEDRSFRIVEEPKSLRSGDLVRQGYPFFAGTISLAQDVEVPVTKGRAVLRIKDLSAVVAMVLVNGEEAGYVFTKPYEIEVTGLIEGGTTNTIEVRLVNSLRNLLGPHHHRAGEPTFVGPEAFSDELNWTEAYHFVPYGLGEVSLSLYDEGEGAILSIGQAKWYR